MTLLEQIQSQKALMESKGAIALRLEISPDAVQAVGAKIGERIENMPTTLNIGMEGFAILATWPET